VADPFLDLADFTIQFGRALSDAETPVAERLLQVVSDWIREHAPDASDLAGEQVVFEVVRDALTYGGLELLSQFQNTTAHRTEAGTFDAAMKAIDDYLTSKHKRLLGIFVRPAYYFGD
jgi:hypothetical protein